MSNAWTPEHYASVVPYLRPESADRVIAFLQAVFDAELLNRATNDDGKVVHAEVRIGAAIVELSDANANWPAAENSLHVFVPDADATYRRALQEGAVSLYEPGDMPYGERSAGVKDAFGNNWFIATFRGGDKRGYYD